MGRALTVVLALIGPWIAPYDPIATDFGAVRKPPSARYWLGTDEVGRDILSRLIWGARASLLAGVIPVTLSLAFSIPLGLLSGYAGGWVDGLIMRVTDAMLAIPFLILAIAMAAFLGPSLTNAMIAIGVAALPTFLRLARGTVLALRGRVLERMAAQITADREADARADSGTCRGAAGRIRIGAGDARNGDQCGDSRCRKQSPTHGFVSLWFEWVAVNCVPNAEAKRVVPPTIVSEPLDERPKFQFG